PIVEKVEAAAPAGRRAADIGTAWGRNAAESAQLVGALSAEKLGYAERLLKQIPTALRETMRDADGAAATVTALLLAPKEEVQREQLRALSAAGLAPLAERVARTGVHTRDLGLAFHLAVVDLALPALKTASDLAE